MLKFSKKVEYALISMLYMAEQQKGQLISARELAESFNIPQELVGKVLQSLARVGFISSVQGVKGGYQLAMEPDKIRLPEVIYAVEGPVRVVNCVDDPENCDCEQIKYCNMRNPMETLQLKLLAFLDSISLKELQTNQFPVEITIGKSSAGGHPVRFIDRSIN
ncbi:MAG: Rrf2 family transcriptional regulator [Calditrichaceae bacterium]|nr:Rrf2 family transcriptional regulator [Calditrichia bacterium]NUQ41076.1 Rrf2 family transcriptional regulator [Calditrichaceae bacterium]